MFGLPERTELKKQIPKTAIFDKFATEMTAPRKRSFDNDISRIYVVNEISPASVNIQKGKNVKSIFVILVELKGRDYDGKNIDLIAKLFGQKIVIALHEADEYRLVIYETKSLYSEWIKENDRQLKIEGLDLDGVWQNLVIQISGISPEHGHTLDEQIAVEAEKDKLKKQISDLERHIKKEQQSKKKFEMHERLLKYRKKLEEM